MFKRVTLKEASSYIAEGLKKGAFLTVKSKDKVNTMTIGWGFTGVLWQKEVFCAFVRPSRYTFKLIEKADSYTVSIPFKANLSKELRLCGTLSGESVDKIKEFNLKLLPGETVDSPGIEDCDLIIECKIIYKAPIERNAIPGEIKASFYPHGDFHHMYIGEITAIRMKTEQTGFESSATTS